MIKEELFAMTKQLLNTVVSRYPEYHSNLLYFITSNYNPAEAIREVAKVCFYVILNFHKQFLRYFIKIFY